MHTVPTDPGVFWLGWVLFVVSIYIHSHSDFPLLALLEGRFPLPSPGPPVPCPPSSPPPPPPPHGVHLVLLQVTRETKRWFAVFVVFALFKVVVTGYSMWNAWEHPSSLGNTISTWSFFLIGLSPP